MRIALSATGDRGEARLRARAGAFVLALLLPGLGARAAWAHAPLPGSRHAHRAPATAGIGAPAEDRRTQEARPGERDGANDRAGSVAGARETWRCPMCESVRQDHPGRCPLCGMDLVRVAAARPLMPGVPPWLFYATSLSLLALSFVLLEIRGRFRLARPPRGARRDLLRLPGLKALAGSPWFRVALQIPVVALFAVVLYAGFFGTPAPERNLATVLTWTIWWTWLVIAIIFVGKLWCTVCPWMAVADWVAGLGRVWREGRPFGLGLKWPRALRNIWLATLLFLGLTWLELGFGVTDKPWLTSLLGVFMLVASVGTVLVFERQAFCRYACLVGRVSGLYSMFAASELRAADPEVCHHCATHDCFHGNERGAACPTGQFMGSLDANTYCILCLECLRTCPGKNIAFNVRPAGADLVESKRPRADEAYLAVIMLSMSAFHGLTMTPAWDSLVGFIESATGAGRLLGFSVGMAGMVLLPLAVYYGLCVVMKWLAGDREHSARQLFVRFAYSLLPIALFYHLAHNLQHIFFEGKRFVRVASDPFGWGWDLFGTAGITIDAMLPLEMGWGIQVALVLAGHIYGILIAHRAAHALYADPRQATRSQLPMIAAMLLFSFQSLWLLTQPMMMRSAM